jgi:hypothetical protein
VARYVLYTREILAEARSRVEHNRLEHQVSEEQISNSIEAGPLSLYKEGNVTHLSHGSSVIYPVDAAGEETLLSQPQGYGKDWASVQEIDQINEMVGQLRVLPLYKGGEDSGQVESLNTARVRILYNNIQSLRKSIVTK